MNYLVILLLLLYSVSSAQNASDYFFRDTGEVWFSEGVMLDSLNQPVDSISFYQADSFATVSTFHGESSSLVLSAFSSTEYVYFSRYVDSTFLKFDNSEVYQYLKFTEIIDSSVYAVFDSALYNSLDSLKDWYPLYDFAAPVNVETELLTKDFTVPFDSAELNMRIKLTTMRKPNETLELEVDTFQTAKFQQKLGLFFLLQLLPPMFPPTEVPFLTLERNVWVAENNWIVKIFSPFQVFDLSSIGGATYWIPGALIQRIERPVQVSVPKEPSLLNTFQLHQNYPNPFNPATTIKYSIALPSLETHPDRSGASQQNVINISLKVYDILGREVATLVNKQQNPGNYEVKFDASSLSSGIYFYTFRAGSFTQSKKMILIK